MELATGAVPVRYETLAGGFLGTDQTVARMSAAAMGKYGSKSPKIRALARNIIVQAGVPEKDYEGEARALGKWVRDNIRYLKDPYGQETLSYPEETAFNMRGGDCLAKGTRVWTTEGYKAIEDVRVEEAILGKDGWTWVANRWVKGVLPVKAYHLNNGGVFWATDDHRCTRLPASRSNVR
jgi:hypothetical protein